MKAIRTLGMVTYGLACLDSSVIYDIAFFNSFGSYFFIDFP